VIRLTTSARSYDKRVYVFPGHYTIPENEFRKDVFGRCVIYTANRSKRPKQFVTPKTKKKILPRDCIFCPGNEDKTPPEIYRVEENHKWIIRVIPNKYYGVHPLYPKAYGWHEVIIETPDHYKTFSDISKHHAVQLFKVFRKRTKENMKDKKIKNILIFKNEGITAGASLEHTHWQLVSSNKKFPESKKYIKYFKNEPGNKLEKLLSFEKERMVFETKNTIVFCPYVSKFNFEVWAVPKKFHPRLDEMNDTVLNDLAMSVHKTIILLDKMLNYPSYNIVILTSPKGSSLQTHVQIYPRIAKWAGFEFGTGCAFNSVLPEVAVKEYKKVL